jgi:N-acyl-D-aspartate/D-glutamate deacylase
MKLVKDALVVDGSGGEGRMGSIIVENDRIKEIVYGSAADNGISQCAFDETVDASGALATPGFIDCHAHSDAYLILEPSAPSKITQGITTEINGQCGGSAAPRYGEARLSSDWAALLGEKLVWRSLAQYRDAFSAANPAVNTVQFIGHNTLRSSVVGYAGREATPDELKAMENLLAKSLDEGGFGLTTGLIYQPGRYSTLRRSKPSPVRLPRKAAFTPRTCARKVTK